MCGGEEGGGGGEEEEEGVKYTCVGMYVLIDKYVCMLVG